MGKRKRGDIGHDNAASSTASSGAKREEQSLGLLSTVTKQISQEASMTVQIVIGTYDKVVHGITANISYETVKGVKRLPYVEFTDSFLSKPHNAAVRCLALSPQRSHKLMLASGSSDQEIQIYQLSTKISAYDPINPSLPFATGEKTKESPWNKSLGALEHHGGAINALYFPSSSKLLSAADDSTIAITRTRDWTALTSIKAPIPKTQGRPSGDTAPTGDTPAGINDIAIHPSMKLMVSVSKGEKCMRLWNLVTGKKAGVLNFERNILQGVDKGKWASGEGRTVRWNSRGEEFVVAFEWGCVVFGIDSRPKYRILPSPTSKVHQLRYIPLPDTKDDALEVLAVSTEDGRLIFYNTDYPTTVLDGEDANTEVKILQPVAQFGGVLDGLTGRIKDFEALRSKSASEVLIIACGSDGAIRLWLVEDIELTSGSAQSRSREASNKPSGNAEPVGQLIGFYQSKNRITCVAAFLMSADIQDLTTPNRYRSEVREEDDEKNSSLNIAGGLSTE